MTLTAPATTGTAASGRTLLTELPGPRSRELHAVRERAVPRGFGVVQPVFVDHAGGASSSTSTATTSSTSPPASP